MTKKSCSNQLNCKGQQGIIPIAILVGLVLVFAVGGWFFFNKNLNLNLKNVASKSLNCQKILERIPNFKKRENPTGQEDPQICYFEYAKDTVETIDDVNIVGNGGIPVSVALDLDAQGNIISKYNDVKFKGQKFDEVFSDLNFITNTKELPKPQGRELSTKDTGQIDLINGKGAFYEYGFDVTSKIPRSEFNVSTVGRNGDCILRVNLDAFTDETLVRKYHLSNGRGYSNTHPDFDHGKKRARELAIEYLHKVDSAVSDFCGQGGKLVQNPSSNPQDKQEEKQNSGDILEKIRNYKANNALDGYDSVASAKIAEEISKAVLKDSSITSEAISGQPSAEESLDQTLKKDPNYKDFYKRNLENTEQAAKDGTLGFVVLSTYGEISAKKPGGDWFDLKQKDVLPLGSTIFTGLNSDAFIVTDHGPLSLKVEPFTELVLTKASLGQFSLPSGKIEIKTHDVDAKVEKSSFLTDFKISSPNASASPTGTGFFFWYNKELHLSIIGVYQGSVDIKSNGSGEKQTVVGSAKNKPNIMVITDKAIIKL